MLLLTVNGHLHVILFVGKHVKILSIERDVGQLTGILEPALRFIGSRIL